MARPTYPSPRILAMLRRARGFAKRHGFVLTGGTAVALYCGHRRSEDLDFVGADDFDAEALQRKLKAASLPSVTTYIASNTLWTADKSGRLSFISCHAKLPRRNIEGVAVATPAALVATKLLAILNRGQPKDYVDVDALLAGGHTTLQQSLKLAASLFPSYPPPVLVQALIDQPPLPAKVGERLLAQVRRLLRATRAARCRR
jgi:hypothetical protein